jgi:hypothetical protein
MVMPGQRPCDLAVAIYGRKYIGFGILKARCSNPPDKSENWSPKLATMWLPSDTMCLRVSILYWSVVQVGVHDDSHGDVRSLRKSWLAGTCGKPTLSRFCTVPSVCEMGRPVRKKILYPSALALWASLGMPKTAGKAAAFTKAAFESGLKTKLEKIS